jgi:hypothetical protein
MAQIFISYRRENTDGHAGRLSAELKRYVGENGVFLDVERIAPGVSFPQVLQSELASCDVMLVVIGKDWIKQRDMSGKRRLDQQEDFVRLEIGTALKRGIPVVPVLVHSAIPPNVSELPEDLKPLAYQQAFELRHDRWDTDVKLLIEKLSSIVPSISYPEFPKMKHTLFTKASVLVFLGSTITIGVAYQTLYLWLELHDLVLFFTWLLLGLFMGKWHATRAGGNVVRDVLLGCAIAVGGAMVMSLVGDRFYEQPFWPQHKDIKWNIAEWQYTAKHMIMIMLSFVAGGALPFFIEKGRAWTKRKVGLVEKA